jgi:hypothetical protein
MTLISRPTLVTNIKSTDKNFKEASQQELFQTVLDYAIALKAKDQKGALNCEIKLEAWCKGEGKKYPDAVSYIQGRIKGHMAKPSGPSFKESVTIEGRKAPLEIRGEGMPEDAMKEIVGFIKSYFPLVREPAGGENVGPRKDWFAGSSQGEVASALKSLNTYLTTKCTTLTFVKLSVGSKCDGGDVEDTLAGQVLPTVMIDGEDRPDYRKADGYTKVPSGLRIFIGPLYFSVTNNYDAMLKTIVIYRWMTVFHELSHKILKTRDHVYELDNCKNIKGTGDAVQCADSWGYFLTDYAAKTNRLPGQTGGGKVAEMKAKFGG